jgi:uncharacterized protein (DUF885 family)
MTAFDRRAALAAMLATAAAPGALAQKAAARASASGRFSVLLKQFAEELLRLSPETATSLGVDSGARAALKFGFADGTPQAAARWAAQTRSMAARLALIDRARLSSADQLRYDAVLHAANAGTEGARFRYGGGAANGFFGGAIPYPVTQQDGALTAVPDFLDSLHSVNTPADAEAYLARAAKMAALLDQESAEIARNAAIGVVPPAFIVRTALGQLRDYAKTPVAEQTLVQSLVRRTREKGIAGDWEARISRIVRNGVYPAIARQVTALERVGGRASNVAGVHKLPDGEAYYRWALKLGTTTNATAEEIHALGLEQNRAIQARMDEILIAQGMTKGSVGERVLALTKDPAQLFEDSDAGRAALIAFCNEKVAATRALMPRLTRMDLKAPLVMKRVPVDIHDGASLGYMNFASLDGSRPAIYYINLKSMSFWPRYQLTTLTAHEGLPGHAWQGAYLAERSKEVPLISSLMGFNAFTEGWALYAEQLCDEQGLYESDPLGRLGYLQAQQFRACRLVVDTGLHAKRWTREQAIRYLVENTGRSEAAMTSEIDRYSVSPGQACGYKMGHNEMLRLREKARAALGSRFDLAGFNDALVQTGGVPLTVLETAVESWIASAKA